jgi:hypothetical protein
MEKNQIDQLTLMKPLLMVLLSKPPFFQDQEVNKLRIFYFLMLLP